jgi:aminoglycoside phosphotransferase (APT) family kinase protein
MHESAPLEESVVLSPEWLSGPLGAPVRTVDVVERLETVATKVRFRVEYEHGARDANGLVAAFCVKAYFNPAMRTRVAAGEPEARFYTELAPTLPIRVPPCVYAAIDPETGHALVLMEDLVAQGATFLTALSPYTTNQARGTLEQLARLHAEHWDDPGLATHPFLAPRLPSFLQYVDADRLQSQLDGPRGDDLPTPVKDAARLRAALLAIAERDANGPQVLVHGDTHAGNLYELPGGAPGIIDWQVVQQGSWALDVAYHLGAVLDVDARRAGERDLLEHYLGCLAAAGAPAPDLEDAWFDYRSHLAYGYFMWAITQMVDPPIIETFTRRLGLAVADHDSFGLLGV